MKALKSMLIQIHQDIPRPGEPVDFSDPLNVVLYIIMPILMVSYYLYWRKKRKP